MEENLVTDQTQEVVTVQVKLRPAIAEDLKVDRKTLKVGQAFWLRSAKNGEFQNFPMRVTHDMNVGELTKWLLLGMIYVPITWIEDYDAHEK